MSTERTAARTPKEAGAAAWAAIFAREETEPLEFPANPYGDEWDNKPAQDFRRGFDSAARRDGYTYSDIDGEYHEGGEFQTDEFEVIE